MNAVHYYIWVAEVKHGDFVEKVVNTLLSPIPKYLFTKEYKKKCDDRLLKAQKTHDKFFYDKETGFHIGNAKHKFGYFYSGYSGFISFILVGIYFRFSDNINFLTVALLVSPPILLFYIPAYRAVFSKDRYLEYFKQFEKEDEQWHKKWKWITIVFCVGSVMTTLMGICATWAILLL